jgi:hypothetical protein
MVSRAKLWAASAGNWLRVELRMTHAPRLCGHWLASTGCAPAVDALTLGNRLGSSKRRGSDARSAASARWEPQLRVLNAVRQSGRPGQRSGWHMAIDPAETKGPFHRVETSRVA